MKTVVIIEVDHRKPIPGLAAMVAGRTWSIDGVIKAEVVRLPSMDTQQLQDAGFTLAEISLGSQDISR